MTPSVRILSVGDTDVPTDNLQRSGSIANRCVLMSLETIIIDYFDQVQHCGMGMVGSINAPLTANLSYEAFHQAALNIGLSEVTVCFHIIAALISLNHLFVGD